MYNKIISIMIKYTYLSQEAKIYHYRSNRFVCDRNDR